MSVCEAGHGGADDIWERTEEKAKPGKEEDGTHETSAPTPTFIGRVMGGEQTTAGHNAGSSDQPKATPCGDS